MISIEYVLPSGSSLRVQCNVTAIAASSLQQNFHINKSHLPSVIRITQIFRIWPLVCHINIFGKKKSIETSNWNNSNCFISQLILINFKQFRFVHTLHYARASCVLWYLSVCVWLPACLPACRVVLSLCRVDQMPSPPHAYYIKLFTAAFLFHLNDTEHIRTFDDWMASVHNCLHAITYMCYRYRIIRMIGELPLHTLSLAHTHHRYTQTTKYVRFWWVCDTHPYSIIPFRM